MAYKLILPVSNSNMPILWNVSQHVGPLKQNPNSGTDVELVQFLVMENISRGLLGFHANAAAKLPPISLDGIYSAVLGFWIYYAQSSPNPSVNVDGVVSP